MSEVQQVSLRWLTPNGRMNPRAFRNQVGFHLGKLTHAKGTDWGWLFNAPHAQPQGGGIATSRFSTGFGRNGAFAQIVAIGDEASAKLAAALPDILQAVRAMGFEQQAAVDTNQVWIKPSEQSQLFRAQTVVLTKLRGDRAFYAKHREEPALIKPYLQEAVASGLNRQAERIGLPSLNLEPSQVEVVELGQLGTQPVHKGPGEAMLSRLSQAIIKLPCRLNGDWRVGGLLTYGNGLVTSIAAERHWRQMSDVQHPYPTMRLDQVKVA